MMTQDLSVSQHEHSALRDNVADIPPLPVHRIREPAYIEGHNRRVDIGCDPRDERAFGTVMVHKPERDGYKEAEENGEWDDPVGFTEGKSAPQLLAMRSECTEERQHTTLCLKHPLPPIRSCIAG